MTYDCFAFFDELDLLDLRLELLVDCVDKHVIVEGTRTFTGLPKPLYYGDNMTRYAQYRHKIIHVVVDKWPLIFGKYHYKGKRHLLTRLFKWPILDRADPHAIDDYQKEHIRVGLSGCSDDDHIIVSDLDEFPNPDAIAKHAHERGVVLLQMLSHYYYLNCRQRKTAVHAKTFETRDGWVYWNAAVMLRYKDLNRIGSIRSVRREGYHRGVSENIICEHDGGWHFSFLGGPEAIRKKMAAYAHQEYNNDEYLNTEWLSTVLARGGDLLKRGDEFEYLDIDDTFPNVVIRRESELVDKGYIYPVNRTNLRGRE